MGSKKGASFPFLVFCSFPVLQRKPGSVPLVSSFLSRFLRICDNRKRTPQTRAYSLPAFLSQPSWIARLAHFETVPGFFTLSPRLGIIRAVDCVVFLQLHQLSGNLLWQEWATDATDVFDTQRECACA